MTACSDVLCSQWKSCQMKVRLVRISESKQLKALPQESFFCKRRVLRSGFRRQCGKQNAGFVL